MQTLAPSAATAVSRQHLEMRNVDIHSDCGLKDSMVNHRPVDSSPCRPGNKKPSGTSPINSCSISPSSTIRMKKLQLKSDSNLLESTTLSPKSTTKMENLASLLVKNLFKKRLQTQRHSSSSHGNSPVSSLKPPILSEAEGPPIFSCLLDDVPSIQCPENPSSPNMVPLHSDARSTLLMDDDNNDDDDEDDDAFHLKPPVSPMSQRLRTNLSAIYSMYHCGKSHDLETESVVLGSDDGFNTELQIQNQSSCTYNFLPTSWFSACTTDGIRAVDLTSEGNFSTKRGFSTESVCTDVHFPVLLHLPEELSSFPCILSEFQMKQLRKDGLPPTVKLMSWIRAYSLKRDGDCFDTMVHHLSKFRQTLVVIQTTRGDILGGYSDIPWVGNMDPLDAPFAGGRIFLFANRPGIHGWNRDECNCDKGQDLRLFHWNGKNNILRMSSMNRECFGMGDGDGAFGWFVQNDFTRGITGPCESFESPPLTNDVDGIFSVKDIEVWGFLPMLTAFHQSQYQLIRGWKRSTYFSPSEVSMPLG